MGLLDGGPMPPGPPRPQPGRPGRRKKAPVGQPADPVTDAVRNAIAAKVIVDLGGEARDAILTAAVTKVLGTFDFQDAVTKVVLARASEVAAEAVRSGGFDAVVTAAVTRALGVAAAAAEKAVVPAVMEALAGVSGGGYDARPSLLRRYVEGAVREARAEAAVASAKAAKP